MPETASATIAVEFPAAPNIPFDMKWQERSKIRKPVEEYQRLAGELREAVSVRVTLEEELAEARERDRRALASAVAAGERDPGTPSQNKLSKRRSELDRRIEGLRDATVEAARTAELAFGADQNAWIADEQKRYEEAHQDLLKQLRSAQDGLRRRNASALLISRLQTGKASSDLPLLQVGTTTIEPDPLAGLLIGWVEKSHSQTGGA